MGELCTRWIGCTVCRDTHHKEPHTRYSSTFSPTSCSFRSTKSWFTLPLTYCLAFTVLPDSVYKNISLLSHQATWFEGTRGQIITLRAQYQLSCMSSLLILAWRTPNCVFSVSFVLRKVKAQESVFLQMWGWDSGSHKATAVWGFMGVK